MSCDWEKYDIKDPKVVADEFNEHLTSVRSVMKLATEYAIDMDVILPPPDLGVLEQFSFKTITKQKLPRNKSPGADKIPVKILKDCLSHISAPMTDILDNSFTSSTFPDRWKSAEVVPHPKEGDHELTNNNRPIS